MIKKQRFFWIAILTAIFVLNAGAFIFAGTLENPATPGAEFPVRAFHVQVRTLPNTWYEEMIGQLKTLGYNMVMFNLSGVNNATYKVSAPGETHFLTKTREEYEELIQSARSAGVEPVLEIKIIGKQQTFLSGLAEQYPGLLLPAQNVQGKVLNPAFRFPDGRDPYEAVVFPMLDEMISLYGEEKPKFMLLGEDEISPDLLAEAGQPLGWSAAQVFADGVNRCAGYLIQKGITPIIWGDMLLSVRLAQPGHGVNGFSNDVRFAAGGTYHANYLSSTGNSVLTAVNDIQQRDQIIVAHWEYDNVRAGQYPAIDYFQQLGFKDVWGATWYNETAIAEFSRYAAGRECGGMIATTWHTSFTPSVQYLYFIILHNSIPYFLNPDFVPPELPDHIFIRNAELSAGSAVAGATKVVQATNDPVGIEITLPADEVPSEAQFWLTDKTGAELCATALQYDTSTHTLNGTLVLPHYSGTGPFSMDTGFFYYCTNGYLAQRFQRAGLVVCEQLPAPAEKVPAGTWVSVDFSKPSAGIASNGILNVSGDYGDVLLLESGTPPQLSSAGLDIQTLDAAYMYPLPGLWEHLAESGIRVVIHVVPEKMPDNNAAIITFGGYMGGWRLMLAPSGTPVLQIARASGEVLPVSIRANNRLIIEEMNKIEFYITPPDVQNCRTASLKVNEQEKQAVISASLSGPDGAAPLGFGTDFKRRSRSEQILLRFPGKIFSVEVRSAAVADSVGSIIAGWDSLDDWTAGTWSASIEATDITAGAERLDTNVVTAVNANCNDGTFGTFPGAGVDNGAIMIKNESAMEFTITNNGTRPYELWAFRFDAWRSYPAAATNLSVSVVSGDITTGLLKDVALVVQGANPTAPGGVDFQDADLSLTGLADHTLAAGESVTFRITAGPGNGAYLDNIAVTGKAVLE